MEEKIEVKPIGYVTNERNEIKDDYWGSITSTIELVKDIPLRALKGIEEFSHLEIIFHFHQLDKDRVNFGPLHLRGNTSWPEVGLYASRKKRRPNFLGLTIVELLNVDGRVLTVQNLDANNGTSVIDIKPVLNQFLPNKAVRHPDWYADLMKDYWAE